jgi:hypothetical protein
LLQVSLIFVDLHAATWIDHYRSGTPRRVPPCIDLDPDGCRKVLYFRIF